MCLLIVCQARNRNLHSAPTYSLPERKTRTRASWLAYAFNRGKTSSTSKRNDVVSGNPSFFNWKDTTPRSINGLSFSIICLGVPIKGLGEWICELSTLLISVPSGTHRQPPNQLLRNVAGSRPTA